MSVIGEKKVTLEIYSGKISKDFETWCLLFSAQAGNIYANIYAVKFSPENAQKKATEFDKIIAELNAITLKSLQAQKEKLKMEAVERAKLKAEIAKWSSVLRNYEIYSKINADLFWETNDILLMWDGDIIEGTPGSISLMYDCWDCEDNLDLLRKVATKIKTL